jgi:flagellar protein FlgJ
MVDGQIKSYMDITLLKSGYDLGLDKNSSIGSKQSQISGQTSNELQNVADQFEAIFLETLLRQARESKLSDGLFDSQADDNFEQMFDQELAKSSSKLVDIGIADAIVRQMSKTRI